MIEYSLKTTENFRVYGCYVSIFIILGMATGKCYMFTNLIKIIMNLLHVNEKIIFFNEKTFSKKIREKSSIVLNFCSFL